LHRLLPALLPSPRANKRTLTVTVQTGAELHAKRVGGKNPFSGTADTGFSGADGQEGTIVGRFRSNGPGSFGWVEWGLEPTRIYGGHAITLECS
jgi:hypothetical protein